MHVFKEIECLYILYYISLRFIIGVIYIILNLNSYRRVYRAGGVLSNSFSNRLYKTLVFS